MNLEALNRNTIDLRKKDLLMELVKLYGKLENFDKGESKKDIKVYIESNCNEVKSMDLLLNIITKFILFANKIKYRFCFIIDQVSFTKDYGDIDSIYKIMNTVKTCPYLKLIICTTLNNDYSKDSLNIYFKDDLSLKNNEIFDFYYFQNFFSKKDIDDYILKDEKEEIKDVMRELGNLPGHFYEIKNNNNNIENYIHFLETNINENLKLYYKDINILKIYHWYETFYIF